MPKAPAPSTDAPSVPLREAPKAKIAKQSDALTGTTLSETTDTVNALWYGKSGTGKTTALAALANLGPVVIINAEGGLKRRPLQNRGINVGNIEVFTLADYDRKYECLESVFWNLKARLDDDPTSIVGVCWDSITEIHKVLIRESIDTRVAKATATGRGSDDPFFIDRSDYGVMTEQMRILIRRYRDLPCHFGVTALERREVDQEDGRVTYGPAITPAIANDLFGYMDIVCHSETLDDEYVGRFNSIGKYEAKDRFDALPRTLAQPWFDRVVAYVNDELTDATDPIQLAIRERIANSKTPAATTAVGDTTDPA